MRIERLSVHWEFSQETLTKNRFFGWFSQETLTKKHITQSITALKVRLVRPMTEQKKATSTTGSAMKHVALVLVLVLALSCTLSLLPVKAEGRTVVVPDDYPTLTDAVANAQTTLGPIVSMQNNGGNIRIVSIQNQSSLGNPIKLVFCVEAYLLAYCYSRVGDIGYSLDGDP